MRGALVAFALAAAVVASTAQAHGAHHSPIKPGYDCFHNPDGIDTAGDVVLTYDEYMEKFFVWKCECEWSATGYRLCWWRLKFSSRSRDAAIEKMRELSKPASRYGPVIHRRIPVIWRAWHDTACTWHEGYRWVKMRRRIG